MFDVLKRHFASKAVDQSINVYGSSLLSLFTVSTSQQMRTVFKFADILVYILLIFLAIFLCRFRSSICIRLVVIIVVVVILIVLDQLQKPPEQLRSMAAGFEFANQSTDMYSLGMVAYQIVVGQLLYFNEKFSYEGKLKTF